MATPYSAFGKLNAKEFQGGSEGRFTVAENSVASFPIGTPTFTADQAYPDVGKQAYQSATGVGITTNTTPSEAVSKFDDWLLTYLLDAPPRLTAGATETTTTYIQVAWTNPVQKKLGFTTTFLPAISNVKAIVVPSANNVAQNWAHSSAWTINMEVVTTRPTVTSLRIFLDFNAGSSNLTSNRFNFYGTTTATRIIAETNYDIRVYADNEAVLTGDRTARFIDFLNVATQGAGVPGAPSALAVNSITSSGATASWTAPTVRDINDSNSTALFARYGVNLTPGTTVRYGGALSVTSPQLTALASGTNAVTTLALTLNPGQEYSTTVQARNSLNANYGAASSPPVVFTTSLPVAPSYPASTGFAITNAGSISYATSGYTLDGVTAVNPVFRYATMTGTPPLGTTYTNMRLNVTAGSTATGISTASTVVTTPVPATHTASRTFDGFGATAINGNVDSGAARLTVSADGDFYGVAASQGFFRSATVQAAATAVSTLLRASPSAYTMGAAFTYAGGSNVTTNTVTFYVDEASVVPTIAELGITDVGNTVSYVTGVPTFNNGSLFTYQVNISNIAHTFLRADRTHFTASLQTSAGTNISSVATVTKVNVNGTTIAYYDPATNAYEASTTLHNTTGATLQINPGTIQIRGSALTLTLASSTTFNEALRLSLTPTNMQGAGSTSTKSGRMDVTSGTSTPLRVDTQSLTYLSGMAGAVMSAGSGQFPTSGFTTAIDHTASIVSTDQLQLVNGRWSTKTLADGYKNYGSFWFPSGTTQTDYSGISGSGFRYTCIRFQNLKGSGTYDVITFAWTQTGLTLTPANDTANFRCYLKVVDGAFTSPWVSLTAAITGAGWGAISSNGQGIMDNGNSSASSIRCFVPTGTNANATIYLRFGLDQALSQSVTNITATAV